MGQKSSKKADLFVTGDVTHCKLPTEDAESFRGREREYTAIDVRVETSKTPDVSESNSLKKRHSPPADPHSLVAVLSKAHRQSYKLAFVVPKIKGSKPSKLERNSSLKEDKDAPAIGDAAEATRASEVTHTVFLLRPKIKSRIKKEFSLKRMEAQRTLLNVMMDIEKKWGFVVKEFSDDRAAILSGKYEEKLQEMISEEAKKGGRLLSVMTVDKEGRSTTSNGNSRASEETVDVEKESQTSSKLTLRLVFLLKYDEDVSPAFQYTVACHQTKCTETALKTKKGKTPVPSRATNITWSEDWLALFKSDSRLTEVINVGEIPSMTSEKEQQDSKPKKAVKIREFEVCTLCFYEKPLRKDKTDDEKDDSKTNEDEEYPGEYDGLIREVWAPIDDNIQTNLESEAEKYGRHGWELCTVLVTSHVRMKSDGSEFRKCAIFFQRPTREYIPTGELDRSKENLLEGTAADGEEGNQEESSHDVATPTSPKEKVEKFGYALMPVVDLDRSKLRAASRGSPKHEKKEASVPVGLAAVQLKKVDRDKLKKEEAPPESNVAQQVKLRHTETKSNVENKEPEKEVPWMATLEKKRKAVMKQEEETKLQTKAIDKEEAVQKTDKSNESESTEVSKDKTDADTHLPPPPPSVLPEDGEMPRPEISEDAKTSSKVADLNQLNENDNKEANPSTEVTPEVKEKTPPAENEDLQAPPEETREEAILPEVESLENHLHPGLKVGIPVPTTETDQEVSENADLPALVVETSIPSSPEANEGSRPSDATNGVHPTTLEPNVEALSANESEKAESTSSLETSRTITETKSDTAQTSLTETETEVPLPPPPQKAAEALQNEELAGAGIVNEIGGDESDERTGGDESEKSLEDIAGSLPTPPPDETFPRDNESALLHLYLPSPPPLSELSPTTTPNGFFTENNGDRVESQAEDNENQPPTAIQTQDQIESSSDNEKTNSNLTQSDNNLPPPIPPPDTQVDPIASLPQLEKPSDVDDGLPSPPLPPPETEVDLAIVPPQLEKSLEADNTLPLPIPPPDTQIDPTVSLPQLEKSLEVNDTLPSPSLPPPETEVDPTVVPPQLEKPSEADDSLPHPIPPPDTQIDPIVTPSQTKESSEDMQVEDPMFSHPPDVKINGSVPLPEPDFSEDTTSNQNLPSPTACADETNVNSSPPPTQVETVEISSSSLSSVEVPSNEVPAENLPEEPQENNAPEETTNVPESSK